MDVKGVRSAIDLIRDASRPDLIIVSLFLLPILLVPWSLLLNTLDFLNGYADIKFTVIVILSVVYIISLIVMKAWDPSEQKLKRARYHVENRLKNRRGRRASFKNIRETVNSAYDDKLLLRLIDENPTVFRRVRIKKYGPGITLVEEEAENEPNDKEAEGQQKK